MADEWGKSRLGDLSEVITKGTTPTTLGYSFTDFGVNFVKSESVTFDGWIDPSKFAYIDTETHEALKRSQLKEGDILFSMAGVYIGKTAVVPSHMLPANTNQAVGIVRLDKRRAVPRFIDYHLRNPSYNRFLNNLVAQSAQPNLNLTEIRNLPINLPPIPEQRAIAHILGTLDDKIELNRRMNATLEAMARALFQSWFVDFDPVRAKLDGRIPPGLDPATAALFPAHFQDSPLRPIPQGWTVGKVSDIATLSRTALNPGDFPDETFDHFSLPAFDNGRRPKVEFGSAIMSNKLVVAPNSVLLSKLNPHIPRIWLPDLRDSHRSVCSTEFMIACAKPGVYREYLFSMFTSSEFASVYGTLVTGTTGSHQRIRPENVLEMKIVLPPFPLIKAFTNVVKPMFDRINRNTEQSQTLAALRDTLLPKLLSGEIGIGFSMKGLA